MCTRGDDDVPIKMVRFGINNYCRRWASGVSFNSTYVDPEYTYLRLARNEIMSCCVPVSPIYLYIYTLSHEFADVILYTLQYRVSTRRVKELLF